MRWALTSAAVESMASPSVGGVVYDGSRWWAAVRTVGRKESEREEMRGKESRGGGLEGWGGPTRAWPCGANPARLS
jgi:hypothetical protein